MCYIFISVFSFAVPTIVGDIFPPSEKMGKYLLPIIIIPGRKLYSRLESSVLITQAPIRVCRDGTIILSIEGLNS